jgi:hypothetical protein
MPGPGAAAPGRWLRQGARLVVHRRGAASAACAATQAIAARRSPGCLRCAGHPAGRASSSRGGYGAMMRSAPRRAACAIAFAALLVNLLVPAALAIGIALGGGTVGTAVCGATAEPDHPGKTNPALFVHHCSTCTVPAGSLPLHSGGPTCAVRIAHTAYPVAPPALVPSPFRHSPLQARAPPLAV